MDILRRESGLNPAKINARNLRNGYSSNSGTSARSSKINSSLSKDIAHVPKDISGEIGVIKTVTSLNIPQRSTKPRNSDMRHMH